jgi:serine phosphatase RsbU (regulator of sigma subunit)/anti-sigma regulatory factor (Ser/Thr protein kinase)
MKAWWYRLSLHNKIQLPIQLVLLVVLLCTQVWVRQQFEINLFETAEDRAISSATQSFLALNSMMLNGNINQPQARSTYFKKMASQDGVKDFHLVRGMPVQNQFGKGLEEEQAQDEIDRKALSSNSIQVQYLSVNKATQHELPQLDLRVVVPFAAKYDFHGVNCMQCHHVPEGAVNGAVSLTISLDREYAELKKLSILLFTGQVMLQLLLFFLIGISIRKSISTVLHLEKTMLSIKTDGDLNRRAEVNSGDEVGHIAQVLNGFIQYMGELKYQLADQVSVLEEYHDRSEQELKIAARYMNKLIAVDKLRDTAVQFYLKPAENFSGDLIAIARTPDNRLHLLLADSTGHGLSAALAAMPMIHPFYSMTSKGFTISAIAKEINKKVWQSLPVSHFVAAIIVSIDSVSHMVEVWSGGCPSPFILNSKGECEHLFKPRHLAMGILPPDQFDASVEYYSFEDYDSSLVMFSDGVTELENKNGEQFGLERLLNTVHVADKTERWERAIQEIESYCADSGSGSDDIALMMVQFQNYGRRITQRKTTSDLQAQNSTEGSVVWKFALTLTMHQIRKLDVVPLLLDIVQQIEKDKDQGGEIFMVLSEMFNNALDHGILKLDSSLKHHEEGMEKYFDERATRLAITHSGHIQLNLKKIVNADGSAYLWIRVIDTGNGFDYRKVADRIATDTQRHGRGLTLLYQVCRSVQFLNGGSGVLVEFDLLPENEQ